MPENIPAGWLKTRLGDVCLPVANLQPYEFPDTEFTYFDIGGIDNKRNRIAETKNITGRSAPSRARQILHKDDILFSTVRTYLRKIAQVEHEYPNPLASTGFAVIRAAAGISPKYLFYQILTERFLTPLHALQSGSSYPAVRVSDVLSQPVLIAPTAEQKRIVKKLTAVLSGLDKAEKAAQRALARLQRYRISVLQSAVTGELTQAWRNASSKMPLADEERVENVLNRLSIDRKTNTNARWEARHSKRLPLGLDDLPELPEEWTWATVEEVGEVTLGRQRSPKHHTGEHMRPYLRVANVFEDRLDLSDVKQMNFTPREFEAYLLKKGDILLNEGQSLELIGRPAMYRDEIADCCFQNTLIRFRVRPPVSSEYALIVFRAYFHYGQFRRIAKITTNLAHLGADRFAQLEFPFPPLAEQLEIVREVEHRLTAAAQLSAVLEQQLDRTQETREMLLNDAFAGRLVPQDPQDEPASFLLEQIRAAEGLTRHAPKVKQMSKRTSPSKTIARRSLLQVLKENGAPMTPEALFQLSGHSQDSVDLFFAELRELTAAPSQVMEERNEEGLAQLKVAP